ncbi:DUF4290 domain-containing protein [Prevotella communis]|jgi:hypothetical protein|uniref:DUF4290 domain-containing protein n=1 Tax=Prevotella communis TaxID=2913614 RepID=A0A1H0F9B8_9BACT|nr:DUF4290 domain-containing protein [Prevotella communis]MCR5473453.1 DUF4290 domain-containing protein [Prevotella sp.]UKK56377.1 DUF4290 domain-containing protein [Prevotella communis]UKK59133.1 DUF4290 domain-containing protein [Prevotella communis]UKK61906.1 DUF4290 domain-containing protein [Prevotella communis]UKK64733.1 DUF4290 domain-containing protein [Prevotella communis]
MNIQGLDYNTQRELLQMPEYGREIQRMIDHAVTLPTKEERLLCAKTIVKLMETKVPQIRENSGYEQTLWDHLYIMSHKQLDIDWPYDISGAEKFHDKPQPMKLPQSNVRLRHYGKLVSELLEKLKDMPEGGERDELIRLTANQMKRDLVQWGHGSIDDEKVADDMARMTDGAVQLDLNNFVFERINISEPQQKRSSGKKKK